MDAQPEPMFRNGFTVGIGPPQHLEDVIDHAYVGHYNEFEWWGIVPGDAPPDHRGFTMEERDGRGVEVSVETFGEPVTAWLGRVVAAYPALWVSLTVDGMPVAWWSDGQRLV